VRNVLRIATVVAAFWHSPAMADADLCKDILRDGVMQRTEIRSHTFFQQAIVSSLDQKAEEKKESNTSGNLSIPFGQQVFGGSYNEKDVSSYLNELHKKFELKTLFNRQFEAILSIGDPTIANAWGTCMGRARGISMRFVPQSPTAVALYIQWWAYPTAPDVSTSTKLTEDIAIPANFVKSGQQCLKAGNVLGNGSNCVVNLEFPNGEAELFVTANTLHGTAADAYLPKRRILIPERVTWRPQQGEKDFAGVYSFADPANSPMQCVNTKEDWKFVLGSMKATALWNAGSATSEAFRCKGIFDELSPGQVCFHARAEPGGAGDNTCVATLTGEIISWKEIDGLQY
jgi:hypothetical protein